MSKLNFPRSLNFQHDHAAYTPLLSDSLLHIQWTHWTMTLVTIAMLGVVIVV